MRRRLCLAILAVAALSVPLSAQVNPSNNATSIIQGGNTAIVTSAGALDVNLLQAAGTTLSVTGSSLNVDCTGGCSSSTFTDNSAFTAGTSSIQPIGGVYNTGAINLTTGDAGAFRLTIDRAEWTDLHALAETVLGAPSNYGTSPGAVAVMGVNANVTNTVGISALPAGTNLIGYTRAQNACSTTNYESVMSNPPTASTSLTATTTCVAMIYATNTTATAATLTVQDQGTGCNSAACIWVDAFSVPPNSTVEWALNGAKFASGIKWNQGTANALSVDIVGNQ